MIYKHVEWEMELGFLSQEKAEIIAAAVVEEHASGLHRNSAIVAAAIKAGWLTGEWDVKNMPPAQVRWMAEIISRAFQEALEIPKA